MWSFKKGKVLMSLLRLADGTPQRKVTLLGSREL